MTENSI